MSTSPRARFSPVSRREFLGRLSVGAASLALAARLQAAEAAGEKKLGIALLGLGNYATNQLAPALQLTKRCRLAGVVTGSPDTKGREWARKFGFPERNIYSYDTMEQLADNRDIDIVYVVTPNALHAGHCLAAIKAGKHIISEKPFTTNVPDAEKVIAACRAAGLKHSIGYRLHFDPYCQTLMRLGADPAVAPFTAMKGDRAFVMRSRVWRAQKALSGGGPLMDLGIYIVQAACMAVGGPSADAAGAPLPGRLVMPVAVTARTGPVTRPDIFQDVEETLFFTLEFANGAKLDAVTSYSHSSDTFRAESAKGWIAFKEHAFTYRGMSVETNRGPLHFDPPVNQQALQMDDFAKCVRESRDSRVSAEMGLRDMKILGAIYEAAKTGKRVTLG